MVPIKKKEPNYMVPIKKRNLTIWFLLKKEPNYMVPVIKKGT